MRLIFFFVLFLRVCPFTFAQETSNVTFNVDIGNNYLFVPLVDTLYIYGNFPGHEGHMPGTDPEFMMTDPEGDWIYTVQMDLPIGEYNYMYFINTGWGCNEFQNGGYRLLQIAESGQTISLDDVFAQAPGSTPFAFYVFVNYFNIPVTNASIILGRYEERFTDNNGFAFYSSDAPGARVPYTITATGYQQVQGFLDNVTGSENFNIDLSDDLSVKETVFKDISIETSSNRLIIHSENEYTLNIYSISGQIIDQRMLSRGTSVINTPGFQKGTFLLIFQNDYQIYSKIIVLP